MAEAEVSGSSGASTGGGAFAADDALLDAPDTTAAGKEDTTGDQPGGEAGDEPDQPPSAIGADVETMLAEARLRTVPGETREQALQRVARHWKGRGAHELNERRELKEQMAQVQAMLARQQQITEAWARDQYARLQAERREAEMAKVPEKGTPEYQEYLLEQNLIRQQQREQAEAEAREQAAAQAEEEARYTEVFEAETSELDALEEALVSDPEVAEGYATMTQLATAQVGLMYPNATPEQVRELVGLAQRQQMRSMAFNGVNIVDFIRASMGQAKSLLGGGRNGHVAAPAPPATPAAAAQPARRPAGSPTAERLRRDSAAAAAKAVVSSPGNRASAPTGMQIDLKALSEEEFVNMALDGQITDDMIMTAVGKPRTSR